MDRAVDPVDRTADTVLVGNHCINCNRRTYDGNQPSSGTSSIHYAFSMGSMHWTNWGDADNELHLADDQIKSVPDSTAMGWTCSATAATDSFEQLCDSVGSRDRMVAVWNS